MIFDMEEDSVGFFNIVKEKEENDYLLAKILGGVSIFAIAGLAIYGIVLFIMKKRKEKEAKREKGALLSKVEKMQEITSYISKE